MGNIDQVIDENLQYIWSLIWSNDGNSPEERKTLEEFYKRVIKEIAKNHALGVLKEYRNYLWEAGYNKDDERTEEGLYEIYEQQNLK